MNITYLGHSCFRIKGKNKTVICDPFNQSVGFSMAKTEADVVTISHDHSDHSCLDRVGGNPFVIRGPGEYEVGDFYIYGFSSFHDNSKGKERGLNTIYIMQDEGFRLCHLGDLGSGLSEKQIEELDGVDVLFLPAGGFHTIDPKQAIALVEKIEPKIVIPMHYRTSDHNSEFDQCLTKDDFVKLWGREAVEVDKLNLKQSDMEEETQLVILNTKK